LLIFKNKKGAAFLQLLNQLSQIFGVPKGIRTPVAAVKGAIWRFFLLF